MKKIFLYSLAVLASVILASCNGDYDDWAQPQHNPQEEAITIPGFTATPVVQSIDCSSVTTDSVSIFTLSEAALPEGFTLDNARLEIIPQGEDNAIKKNVNASIEGKSAVADLAEVTASFYGKRPIAHSFVAHVYLNAVKNGDAVLIDAGKFNLEMTPKAPFIDSGYYLVGDMTDWKLSPDFKFTHSGANVYEDSKFTLVFTTKDDKQCWKIIPQGNVDTGNIWAVENDPKGVVGIENDGDDAMKGTLLTTTSKGEKAGAGKIAKAGTYQMTINMMDYTYTIIQPTTYEHVGLIGVGNDWVNDVDMTEVTPHNWFIETTIPEGNFKIRANHKWDNSANWGYAEGQEFSSTGKLITSPVSQGIKVAGGKYRISFNDITLEYSIIAVAE
jgi:putative lipoprotein